MGRKKPRLGLQSRREWAERSEVVDEEKSLMRERESLACCVVSEPKEEGDG